MPALTSQLIDALFRRHCPQKIVVASSGRSGSTLLYRAITEGFVQQQFPKLAKTPLYQSLCRSSKAFAVSLTQVATHPRPILKTHAPFDPAFQNDARYLFVFGDPLESALSVRQMAQKEGPEWFTQHLVHLHGEGEFSQLLQADVLNYQQQLESWANADPQQVMLVHYDDLWAKQQALSDFVGFHIPLPARRERKKKSLDLPINQPLFEELRALMRKLQARTQ